MYADFSTCETVADLQGEVERLVCLPGVSRVVGWSMGGILALERVMAAQREDLELVLIGATPSFCDPTVGWAPRIVQRMQRNLKRDPEAVTAQFRERQANPACIAKWEQLNQAPAFTPAGLVAGLEVLLSVDLREGLAAWPGKIHWIHGADDPIVRLAAVEAVIRPQDQLTVLPAWHAPQVECPQQIDEVLL